MSDTLEEHGGKVSIGGRNIKAFFKYGIPEFLRHSGLERSHFPEYFTKKVYLRVL